MTVGLVVLIPLFIVGLPLWIFSVLTRVVARILQPQFVTRDQLIEFDPIFGWKARPNLDTHHLVVDLFHLTTDKEGWRGRASLKESDVVVFGDSFAAGYGISDRHFFANLHRKPRIKPVGIVGYSMVHEFLWMQKLAPELRDKLVMWFIFYGNDLYDNLVPDLRGYRQPFLRQCNGNGSWEIVSSHIRADRWPLATKERMEGRNHLPRLAELCSDTYLAKRAYSACEYLIGAGKKVCRDVNARLCILAIPEAWQLTPEGHDSLKAMGADPKTFDPYLPDRRMGSICKDLEVEFVPGSSFLDRSCYKTNDCHWNEHGHRKVADMLCHLYENKPVRADAHEIKAAMSWPKLAVP